MKKKILVLLLAMSVLLPVFISTQPVHAMGESSYIAAGWGTTFYVTKDGTLWGFGKNDQGLLMGSGKDYVSEPVKLLNDVKSIAANRYAALAIKRDGTLWYWGRLPGLDKSLEPVKLLDDVVMASLDPYNNQNILLCKTDGTLYLNSGKGFEQITHPAKVKLVALSDYNKFFINDKDELWGWCTNKNGADGSLGVGHTEAVLEPVKIMEDVQSVAGNSGDTMIIRKDGTLWMCGNGDDGKFYDGTTEINTPVLSPIKVMDNVMHAATYNSHFFAVKRDNTLWAWGANDSNSLGKSHISVPVKWASNVNSITVGYQHKVIAKTDNTVWTGGRKDGVYHAENSSQNELRQTASDLVDSPAPWALAEVREAEYRKLVPPAMQSEYSKVVNRSEFCTLAVTCIEQAKQMTVEEYLTLEGIEIPTSSPFTDIGMLTDRSKKDIMAAYALKIVAGTSATTFEPGNPITREQAAKMLTATAAVMGENSEAPVPAFADGESIENWAKPYIGYVFNAKIMSGVGGNRFDPKGGYQRQQAYMTVLRLYKKVTGIK
ncbi:S-layer homology domain-containing protein [Petroclostridium sp. X23]|uniref:S-layer homology domain-containing protein n=1 Tax=Petroclostridium sp. X23 TaxID=3045146 RepID=UPI0024ACA6F3|nr:S-layer homology domain-containing protein [Petroclostridium sp. X23]WHH61338.1 S-layer homology domain-containing protein [Petroclostridium sp. X23]